MRWDEERAISRSAMAPSPMVPTDAPRRHAEAQVFFWRGPMNALSFRALHASISHHVSASDSAWSAT